MKKKILMLKEVLPIRMYKCNISRYFLKAETMGPMTSLWSTLPNRSAVQSATARPLRGWLWQTKQFNDGIRSDVR